MGVLEYLVIRTLISKGMNSNKIAYEDNLADLFTKTLSVRVFEKHVNCMGLRSAQAYFRVSASWLM